MIRVGRDQSAVRLRALSLSMGQTVCPEFIECVEWVHSTRRSELPGRADREGSHLRFIGFGFWPIENYRRATGRIDSTLLESPQPF